MNWRLSLVAFCVALTGHVVMAECVNPATPCDIGAPGDFDADGDVDSADLAILRDCVEGAASPDDAGCQGADLNGDGEIDRTDTILWQAYHTGSCDCGPYLREPPGRAPAEPTETSPDLLGPLAGRTRASAVIAENVRNVYSTQLATGEFVLRVEDLRIRGRGLDLVWARTYRSRSTARSPIGHGWDFSYNIWVERAGRNLRLHDGDGRSDVYYRQPDGTYARREFFRVITALSDGGYRVTFSDGSQWNLAPLDGSPRAGRLTSIVDRNGNTLRFGYDARGRLTTIHDTLDNVAHTRDFTIAYTPEGQIASVTDFTGRTVRYDYYREGDTEGSPGDLRSVTSPAVTGSPAGNNFPDGKTVVYTYSTGSSVAELNHNLLTITDGSGQTWLRNEYGDRDLGDRLSFDRLIRQFWGDTARPIDITYELRSPDGEPRADLVQATVNDRAGYVQEYWFDAFNRLVRVRQHTGRADPDGPTTSSENRPKEPLRPYDPPYFETYFEYNADSLLTRKVHPAGNEEEFDYATGSPRSRGNLIRHIRLPGAIGGSPDQIVTRFSYDEKGSNFVTEMVDPRGSVTTYYYDARGNRTRIHHPVRSVVEDFEYNRYGQLTAHILPDNGSRYRRRDECRYYETGPQRGYLQSRVVDATGLALTTAYEYDLLGRVVRTVDPRGNDTLRVYNELDQVVEEASPELAEVGGVRHRRTYVYDAANNLIEQIVTNFDERGNPLARSALITFFEYDVLGRLIRETREVEPGRDVAIEYAYDAGGSRSLTRYGEATNGNQPADTLLRQYDERGLLYRQIRAAGSPVQSTTQYDYDANGNLRRIFEGLELEHPRTTQFAYDGYDRRISVVDAMGNETKYRYDSNGNRIAERHEGELQDVPGSLENIRLAESVFEYDALNRLVRRIDSHFDPADQSPIGDGQVLTEYEYNGLSQPVRVTDDNNHMTRTVYDSAGRRSLETDPAGNTRSWSYDANGNVIAITRVDRSDAGNPDVRSTVSMSYDALNRLTQQTDPLGHTQRFGYDSRGNRVLVIDERGSATRYVYDGLDRLVEIVLPGQGMTFAADGARIRQRWDDSSRLIARTDPNGNTTTFAYDAAGRLIEVRHADGTTEQSTYDALGNRLTHTDAAGTLLTDTYDRLGRHVARAVTPGPGIAESGPERYTYDGLSRLVAGADGDSSITLHYDSLSRLRRETQQIFPSGPVRTVHYTYDGNGTLTRLVYPGGRAVSYTNDLLDRPSQLRDEPFGPNSEVATFAYLGPDRIERCDFGNATRLEVRFDSDGRIVGTRHSNPVGGRLIDDRTYAYDSAHNLTQMQAPAGLPGESRLFGYDAQSRLIESRTTSDGLLVTYTLDAAGNRLAVDGGPDAATYVLDATTPEPADAQMNQYTSVAGRPWNSDRAGNVTSQGVNEKRYTYDYRNRLVEYLDLPGGLTVMFKYDVLDRRIEKNAGGLITRNYYAGRTLIEEQNQSNITLATYAYRALDSDEPPVQMQRGGQKYFFHTDALGSVVRLTDAAGNVVEQYRYGDYGHPAFFSSTGTPAGSSPSGNPFLFRGYRYEPELGLYAVARRLYDPATGRFLSRADGRVWHSDLADRGNPYTFCGNNPLATPAR